MDVTAVCVLDRIIDDTGCDRVEVHVRDGLPEVIVRIDDPRPVSALPEPSEESPTAVETSGASGLKAQHRTPERVNTGRDHQMTVVADQAPGEHLQAVDVTNPNSGLDELPDFKRGSSNTSSPRAARQYTS